MGTSPLLRCMTSHDVNFIWVLFWDSLARNPEESTKPVKRQRWNMEIGENALNGHKNEPEETVIHSKLHLPKVIETFRENDSQQIEDFVVKDREISALGTDMRKSRDKLRNELDPVTPTPEQEEVLQKITQKIAPGKNFSMACSSSQIKLIKSSHSCILVPLPSLKNGNC